MPWGAQGDWLQANSSLAHIIQLHGPDLGPAREKAAELRRALESIFPHLEELCSLTCPRCSDVCCIRARVWFDFKDLLFLHLGGQELPPGQLRASGKESCRYLGPGGCRLPRPSRPWVCAWYLCPDQKRLLTQAPHGLQNSLADSISAIKLIRNDLESQFILAVG